MAISFFDLDDDVQVEITKHLTIKDSVMLGSTCKHLHTLFKKETYSNHARLKIRHELTDLSIDGRELFSSNIEDLFPQTPPLAILQALSISKKSLQEKIKTPITPKKFHQLYHEALQKDDVFTVINLLQLCCDPSRVESHKNLYDYFARAFAYADKCLQPKCQRLFTTAFSHPICQSMDEFYRLFKITPQWRQRLCLSLLSIPISLLIVVFLYLILAAQPAPVAVVTSINIILLLASLSLIPFCHQQRKFVSAQKQAIKNFFGAAQETGKFSFLKLGYCCWQDRLILLKAPFGKEEFGRLLALQLKNIFEGLSTFIALDAEGLKFVCKPSQNQKKVTISLLQHGHPISAPQVLSCQSLKISRDNCNTLAQLCQLTMNKCLNDLRQPNIIIESDSSEELDPNIAEQAPLLIN